MIETIYKDMQGLTVIEMRMYLRTEISKSLPEQYKELSVEDKFYMYKLFSFLYFCNELDSKVKILECMKQMCDTKEFKDRNQILNKVK